MSESSYTRLVGTFNGESPGPLIIVTAALHGNEPAGVEALKLIFEHLELERANNPTFYFKGKIIGLIGNLRAFQSKQRFLEQDLNRVWTPAFLDHCIHAPRHELRAECLEVWELFEHLTQAMSTTRASRTVFLDLHTTSADGGIFCIPTDETESLELAQHLGVPAIVGLQERIGGTLLGFAKSGGFSLNPPAYVETSADKQAMAGKQIPESPDPQIPNPLCIAFEAGQHESTQSITRAAIAIVRCLRAMGNIEADDLLDFTEGMALPFMMGVPPVVRFRYAHHIETADEFKMRPGYANFQPILLNEHLADDVRGPVLSPEKGLILMPLYQSKGSDGFFIVE